MTKSSERMTSENKTSLVVAVILIVLIGLALWQFYSLAWGEVLRSAGGFGGEADVALAAAPWISAS
jgi:hypothetical protein